MDNVSKRFPGTIAVDDVSFEVQAGEVHALVGENGAGKSTLMKMLAGSFDDYTGTISIHGREVRLSSPAVAKQNGIGMIYQELSLAQPVSITENLLAGRLPRRGSCSTGRNRAADQAAPRARGPRYLDPLVQVSHQPARGPARRDREGARQNPTILVMDEPTSALSREEVERLFAIIGDLKRRGIAIVYISHHLPEIFRIADRVTVMRDGKKIGTYRVTEVTSEKIAELMVGHTVAEMYRG